MISEIGVQCFLAVERNGSFTKTAEELFMTRQAVSKQIAQLEKELDVKLFDRTTAKVEVTPAGALYASYFSNTLKEFEKIRHRAKTLEQKQNNTVRIGSPYDMKVGDRINQAVQKCHEEGLDLQIEWTNAEVFDLVRMLMDEKLDIIITFEQTIYEIENAKELLDILYYTTVSANLTVSKKNPRYSPHAVPADFEDEPCYLARDFFLEKADVEAFQREWKKYGLTIHDVRTSPNRDSMKTMVELGVGFTICTDKDAFTQTKSIANLPLNRKQELYLSWRKAENRMPVLGLLDELTQLCIR